MIAYLNGNILAKENDHLIIDIQGVGYQVYMNEKALSAINVGSDYKLYTYQHVREDALMLFGFDSLVDRKLFLALTSVSGIGPKAGMAFLSLYETDQIVGFLMRGDVAALSAVPGIGKKSADRLALELKDKIAKLLPDVVAADGGGANAKLATGQHAGDLNKLEETFRNEISLALSSLGYSTKEIESAIVSNIDQLIECEGVEDAIKVMLRNL